MALRYKGPSYSRNHDKVLKSMELYAIHMKESFALFLSFSYLSQETVLKNRRSLKIDDPCKWTKENKFGNEPEKSGNRTNLTAFNRVVTWFNRA